MRWIIGGAFVGGVLANQWGGDVLPLVIIGAIIGFFLSRVLE